MYNKLLIEDHNLKMELEEKNIENICYELFKDISPIIEWGTINNIKTALILTDNYKFRVRYIIKYIDKDTIEFYENNSKINYFNTDTIQFDEIEFDENSPILRSKAKNIEGFEKGIKTMLLLRSEINKFNKTVF